MAKEDAESATMLCGGAGHFSTQRHREHRAADCSSVLAATRRPSSLLKKVSGTLKACENPEYCSARKVPDTFFNRLLTS